MDSEIFVLLNAPRMDFIAHNAQLRDGEKVSVQGTSRPRVREKKTPNGWGVTVKEPRQTEIKCFVCGSCCSSEVSDGSSSLSYTAS